VTNYHGEADGSAPFAFAQGQGSNQPNRQWFLLDPKKTDAPLRETILLSDRQLRQTIADLKAIEKASFGSRRRFAFVAYLGAVYTFYELLRRKRVAKSSAHRIAKRFGVRTQERTHPIRIIIDATSAATDAKMKSRWTRALRFAWRQRHQWNDLQEIWREYHGPAGAAARWSALRSRDRNGQVGLDTQDLVPESPSIVDVDRLMPGQMYVRGNRVFRTPDVSDAGNSTPVLMKEGPAREMPQRKGA
jgi:hypothetical protein